MTHTKVAKPSTCLYPFLMEERTATTTPSKEALALAKELKRGWAKPATRTNPSKSSKPLPPGFVLIKADQDDQPQRVKLQFLRTKR